jgi:putative colanic acid biosynthesis acetyltransferase WcaF
MEQNKIDLSKYKNSLSIKNQIARFAWNIIWGIYARPLPRSIGRRWKIFLLNCFGAKIHSTANVYSSAKVYMPWNLEMHEYSCLAPQVDCYNVGKIIIGAHTTVSQKAYLCAASHDITLSNNPLITASIIIKEQAWIGADAYVAMGVTIGQGAVVGARSAVFKDVEPWTIVGGNPSRFLKNRVIIK